MFETKLIDTWTDTWTDTWIETWNEIDVRNKLTETWTEILKQTTQPAPSVEEAPAQGRYAPPTTGKPAPGRKAGTPYTLGWGI